jgi:hypothetical protein
MNSRVRDRPSAAMSRRPAVANFHAILGGTIGGTGARQAGVGNGGFETHRHPAQKRDLGF